MAHAERVPPALRVNAEWPGLVGEVGRKLVDNPESVNIAQYEKMADETD